MASFVVNVIITIVLSIICGSILYVMFRRALEPLLNRYNIPLTLFNREDRITLE
uniref:ARAD1A15444p n=1 Tax=Blastobotrys adeninivorans TaxID=409370 RepID=A0A060SXV8_BLAAD